MSKKKTKKVRTFRNLMEKYDSAYVKIGIGHYEKFMQQVEDEGFTFPGGNAPTSKEADDLMVINNKLEVYYTGWCGRNGFGAIINGDGKSFRICVDYERFINNKKFDLYKLNKKSKKSIKDS